MTPVQRYTILSRLPPDLPLALMDVALGVIYLWVAPGRTSSAAFRVAKALMPISLWGVYFLLVGLGLLAVVLWSWVHPIRKHPSYRILVLRALSAALYAMWAIMFGISGVIDQRAALGGIPIYLYLAYRHSFAPAGR